MDSRTLPPSAGEGSTLPRSLTAGGCVLAGLVFAAAVVLLFVPRSVSFDDVPAPAELPCGSAVAPEPWAEWDQPQDAYVGSLASAFASEYCPDAVEQMRAGSAALAALGVFLLAALALRLVRVRHTSVVLAAAALLSPLVLRVPLVVGGDYTWSSFEVSATWSWLLVGCLTCAASSSLLVRSTRPRAGAARVAARSATLGFSMTVMIAAIALNYSADPAVFFGSGPTVAMYQGPSIYSVAPLLLGVVASLAGIRDHRLTRRGGIAV